MSADRATLLAKGGSQHSPEHIRAVNEAAQWYARLQAGQGSDALQCQWAQWLAADPEHGLAWEKVQQVCQQFARVPGKVAGNTLTRSMQQARARRGVLRGLAILVTAGAGGAVAYRMQPLAGWGSDLATATGERRDVTLADLSMLSLNTRTRVDVAFSETQRVVRLQQGEILVTTHPDQQAMARPFIVETRHGRITALGTRFNVRVEEDETRVTVLEKAVEVRVMQGSDALRLEAGQQLAFSSTRISSPVTADASVAAWQRGRLVVVDMPLRQFVAELARYRSGHLGCDDAVAAIRVSGAFPLDDVEQTLLSLTESFPLRIERFTRFWTTIKAA